MIFIMVFFFGPVEMTRLTLDTELANVPFHHEIEKRLGI